MHKDAYYLIDDCRDVRAEDAPDMALVAVGVHESIVEGISAIGSLMFWASNSEDYAEDQAKKDMMKLGDMLTNISRLAAGAKTAEENLNHAIRKGAQQ